MAPRDLAGLLTPVEPEGFLRTCWGQNFLHVPGAPGKFADLLPWPALNRILEQHRLDTPRVRLTREGKPVPPASFLSYATNRRRPNQPIARLRGADLTRELREGQRLYWMPWMSFTLPSRRWQNRWKPCFACGSR